MYREIKQCLDGLNSDPDCRVVVLTGAGKNFTAGECQGEMREGSSLVPRPSSHAVDPLPEKVKREKAW